MSEQIKEGEEMMSDRLTRLIDGFVFGTQIAVNSIEWNSAKVKELADYLIANGVIVPPCNVGDHVFVVYGLGVQHTSVSSMKIEPEDAHLAFILKCMVSQGGARFEEFLFGKTVFLTCEEAKKALKDRSGRLWKV